MCEESIVNINNIDKCSILISVVIPVYNRENTIRRCIMSVLQQTLLPYEIIIVDDGSADNTIGIVEEIKKNSNVNIAIIRGKHKGAQAARNSGIRAAKGEVIAFLDSDDEWLCDWLKRASEVYLSLGTTSAVVCAKGYCDTGNDRTIINMNGISGNIYKDLLKRAWPMFDALFVSKVALEQIGYLDEQCPAYQEWDTCISLSRDNSFFYIDEPMFIWHQDGDIETISSSGKNVLGLKYIICKNKQEILKNCGNRALANLYGRLSDKLDGLEWLKYKIYQVWFYLISLFTS